MERGTYAGATVGVTGKIKERIESVGRVRFSGDIQVDRLTRCSPVAQGWRYAVQTPEGTVIEDVAEDDLAPAADP